MAVVAKPSAQQETSQGVVMNIIGDILYGIIKVETTWLEPASAWSFYLANPVVLVNSSLWQARFCSCLQMFDPMSPQLMFVARTAALLWFHSLFKASFFSFSQSWWLSVSFRQMSYPDSSHCPRLEETDAAVCGLLVDKGRANLSRQDVGSKSSARDVCQ